MSTKQQFAQGNKDLLKLADFLDELPPKRFDYGTWVNSNWKGKPDLSCGTTACAMGWATTIPAFRKRGLHLTRTFEVALDDQHGASAGASLFNISYHAACMLFVPDNLDNPLGGSATPKQVAKHIRKYVKDRVFDPMEF